MCRAASSPPRAADRGFTLIELLIAFALLGLIVLLLFSGLRMASRAWEAVDAAGDRMAELRVARGFVSRMLSQSRATLAQPQGAMLQVGGQWIIPFNGDEERLELIAPLAEQVGLPGLYILRLEPVERDGGRALVLTRWLMHPEILEGTDDTPAWEPLPDDSGMELADLPMESDSAAGGFGRSLLLEDLDQLELAYFGLLDGESLPDWHDEWLSQSTLPALVRVRMTTRSQSWPDLVVRIPGARP